VKENGIRVSYVKQTATHSYCNEFQWSDVWRKYLDIYRLPHTTSIRDYQRRADKEIYCEEFRQLLDCVY